MPIQSGTSLKTAKIEASSLEFTLLRPSDLTSNMRTISRPPRKHLFAKTTTAASSETEARIVHVKTPEMPSPKKALGEDKLSDTATKADSPKSERPNAADRNEPPSH